MSSESRTPSPVFFIALVLGLVVIVAIAFNFGVQTAAYVLAASLVVLAVMRVLLPPGMVPQVRTPYVDAATLVILAAVLAYFANWGDTAPIVALHQ